MVNVTVIEERRCASCNHLVGAHFHLVELAEENARICLCEDCERRLLNRKGVHQVEDHRAG